MKKGLTFFCVLLLTIPCFGQQSNQRPANGNGGGNNVPPANCSPGYRSTQECPDIPFCCPGPGNYPTAPCHGTTCALTVASMALPIILVAGIAAVILTVSEPTHNH